MKVLFIDPYSRDKDYYINALESAGFEVIVPKEAGPNSRPSSTAAAEFIGNEKKMADVGLVITEEIMYTPNGWDDTWCRLGARVGSAFTRSIRCRSSVPIIVLSNMRDADEEKRLRRLSQVFFHRKDETTPNQLVALVRRILGVGG